MKKFLFYTALLLLLTAAACKKIIFLPIMGSIEGVVTDNNGRPLAGVTVSATFDAPTDFGQPSTGTVSALTGTDGYYRLDDLWDDVLLQVDHPGFSATSFRQKLNRKEQAPQVNLTLEGSPTILAVHFSKTNLSVGASPQDSITVRVEIQDNYSLNIGEYQANILLLDTRGISRVILPFAELGNGLDRILLETFITPEKLLPENYSVVIETADPDHNTDRITVPETIRVD